MAYTVVLDFADEEMALTFVDILMEDPTNIHDASDGPFFDSSPPKVMGIYKRPTMFHGPHTTEAGDAKKKGTSWTKGQKWGWWVCAGCAMPSGTYWKNIYNDNAFGTNLLTKLFEMDEAPTLWT